MNKLWSIPCLLLIVLAAVHCKEHYEANVAATQTSNLVVEGYINPKGFTTITLSRTLPVRHPDKTKPELSALVTIRGEDNVQYNVRGTGNGTYRSDSLALNPNQKYRLHIKTNSGGEYLSEYVAVKPTPPIDSVNWKLENDGVHIYVNTHDPQNNTRYYKWDYEETWEIHSTYLNLYKYVNGAVVSSGLSDDQLNKLYYCWINQKSVGILTGSSARLSDDVISEAPIVLIPYASEKIFVRYSILIKQYALDRKAYDFYKMMKTNTESIGSVFDPLPSNLTGNITCVSNPSEIVIGYVAAASVDEKRIFISRNEIPSTFGNGCEITYVVNHPDSLRHYLGPGRIWPYQTDGSFPAILGYYATYPRCLDCTLRGSNVKPSFW
jgi:hypothetical protein